MDAYKRITGGYVLVGVRLDVKRKKGGNIERQIIGSLYE